MCYNKRNPPCSLSQSEMLVGVLCLCLLQATSVLSQLPPDWKVCKKDAACLPKAITDAFQTLLAGNKALDIPPFEPVYLGKMTTTPTGHNLASLDSTFNNFTFYNYKGLTVNKVEFNGKTLKLEIAFTDGPEAKSSYEMKGRVVAVPIYGSGDSTFKFVNTKMSVQLTFKEKPEVKNGKNYYLVEKFTADRSVDRIEMKFSHLEDDQQELENAMLKNLNQNWDVLWEDLRAPFEEALNKNHLEYANKIFSKIPMDDLGLL